MQEKEASSSALFRNISCGPNFSFRFSSTHHCMYLFEHKTRCLFFVGQEKYGKGTILDALKGGTQRI